MKMLSCRISLMPTFSVLVSLLLLAAVVAQGREQKYKGKDRTGKNRSADGFGPYTSIGTRDRFWKHHVSTRTLAYDGVDHYDKIETCLNSKISQDEWNALRVEKAQPSLGLALREIGEEHAYAVQVQNAILPVQVHAIRSLRECVRQHFPHLYESRAMYQEMDLEVDPGMGGNCPTHLVPLLSIFLPDVQQEMQRTLEFAFDGAKWQNLVDEDMETMKTGDKWRADLVAFPPDMVGIRASEHLTYNDFPEGLAQHTDGDSTIYTMNYAFSDTYEGGEFYIIDKGSGLKTHIKPKQYDALVFLGGRYEHGVEPLKGGVREMFSTEHWAFPDLPFGSNLWVGIAENIEEYVNRCNAELEGKPLDGSVPCHAPFPTTTGHYMDINEVRAKYSRDNDGGEWEEGEDEDWDEEGEEDWRPNRIRPQPLIPKLFYDPTTGKEYDLVADFRPYEEEPYFLVPTKLEPGEMVPIRWRHTLEPVDHRPTDGDGESFVVGLPPELHAEFQSYIQQNGMMDIAHRLLYSDGEPEFEPGEHRLYTLNDGKKWSAMIQGSWETDMIWLDPADEACFESLLGVLRRGNFDTVLQQVGRTFDLDGLMVQGVGAIFLSEYEYSENMHIDIPGSKGSFYNIIVPVHIPANDVARFYVGEDSHRRKGTINLDPEVGVVLGGESMHGTGECNYRETKDFRLLFAVYVADINEENVDLIASDSTSLWPTTGDTEWFWSQRGRLWSKHDPSVSLKNDKGRKPFNVKDKNPSLCRSMATKLKCESDVLGLRLKCPKTCQLYMEEGTYYSHLVSEKEMPSFALQKNSTNHVTSTTRMVTERTKASSHSAPTCINASAAAPSGGFAESSSL